MNNFKDFWGGLSQIRRFRDGSILEAVVWPEGLLGSDLINHIAKTALARHVLPACTTSTSDPVHEILSTYSNGEIERFLPCPSGRVSYEVFLSAMKAFDTLRSVLTATELKGMPLPIDRLGAVCPELRGTALFPPFPHPLLEGSRDALRAWAGKRVSRLVYPVKVVVTLRRSPRWPRHPEALRCTVTAMLIRLGEVLREHDLQVQWDLTCTVRYRLETHTCLEFSLSLCL